VRAVKAGPSIIWETHVTELWFTMLGSNFCGLRRPGYGPAVNGGLFVENRFAAVDRAHLAGLFRFVKAGGMQE